MEINNRTIIFWLQRHTMDTSKQMVIIYGEIGDRDTKHFNDLWNRLDSHKLNIVNDVNIIKQWHDSGLNGVMYPSYPTKFAIIDASKWNFERNLLIFCDHAINRPHWWFLTEENTKSPHEFSFIYRDLSSHKLSDMTQSILIRWHDLRVGNFLPDLTRLPVDVFVTQVKFTV